ncbi:HNH endonuclease [Exiguobacterium sp. SH3S2]|uniref:HNH endonuclease n=1 Tax=unclassified Exiguobacterium TaxID=2644629 RepID=UPI00103C8B42|nr:MULTISPECIES: HNH endonuclease [unclassified Exiguobacterium]TCI47379.1 HNH endonuclease [Exiguobacterium sp. SH3S3]TCI60326.1 HNH endonuclease [Exiguobacterium sp. SH3S1]TCI62526.1 HNH endonuclease [Exiguobacterium sp. SH3S2]
MVWIEMRDLSKEQGIRESFKFSKMLWSPAYKNSTSIRKSAYWESLLEVEEGDIILHLVKDASKNKDEMRFIGYSLAMSKCNIVKTHAPHSQYEYCNTFYTVPLQSYQKFKDAISLKKIFELNKEPLVTYCENNNRKDKGHKETIFYCQRQNSLRIVQGAYFSKVDNELFNVLFEIRKDLEIKESTLSYESGVKPQNHELNSELIREMKARIGQQKFSRQVKENFNSECCFPDCRFNDGRHLVGAHIVRWSDDVQTRRDVRNGLSLCKLHDADFELGFFTLDQQYRIRVNKNYFGTEDKSFWVSTNLLPFEYKRIKKCQEFPAIEYIKRHWDRIDFFPDIQ